MTQLATLSLERNGGTAIAAVSGEIDFSNADDLGTRIAEWISNEDTALVVDFSDLSYTDSAGINLAFDLAARLREHGQAFGIVIPADSQPWRTFSIVGIDSQIPVYQTRGEAEAGLGTVPNAPKSRTD